MFVFVLLMVIINGIQRWNGEECYVDAVDTAVASYNLKSYISYLPLTHIYERANQILTVYFGVAVRFYQGPPNQTPTSESEECFEVTTDEIDKEGGRGIRKRWNPVVSNEQRKNSFWKRVADYYKAHVGGTDSNARGTSQCKARWNKINHQVNKFVGCYAQASTRRKSGESEDDVLRMVYEFYKNDMDKPFLLGHCWRELKNDQKWITEHHEECGNKRTKLASEGEFAATSSNGGDEMRPPGVKAAKKKGKKPAVSSDVPDGFVDRLDKIIAMKDQEQSAKEKHGKMRLLDSLLNKSELTPAEVLLRDKLLDQMLTNI
ncbi:PREDICTED: glutathione S-transferase T3-like [Camelina sativa]|uniref:Glutathione S-transferase T3-like n=1 Tax=Camelina sativa TaxID=90675 RepID=A0ABM0SKW8_CAMSA|nr:PREDICTED: glutathione S-transferase T3-like [Camelina sativa]